jgi:dihydrodipicolinate synthase/N-acetylneuraminate lyase
MVTLRGMMVALATPLDERGEVDVAGLERILDRAVAAGVTGICPTGSTGEGARLGRRRRLAVLEAVRARVPDTVHVVPAPAPQTADDAVEEISAFAAAGADAALIPPPAYYPLGADGVTRWFETVADRAELPIVLYNIPVFTKIAIPAAAVVRLAGHPNVAGVKDSSRDQEGFASMVHAAAGQDFALLTGTDTLLVASLVMGGHGAIAASANFAPQLGVAICRAVAEGDLERANGFQRRLHDLVLACRRGEPPAGWKAALELAGLCSGRLAEPATGLDDAERAQLGEALRAQGLL